MSTGTSVVFPNINWAQRPEQIFLSIPLQDADNVRVEIRDGRELHFGATAGGQKYGCVLDLFREVSSEESSHAVLPRQIELKLKKKRLNDTSDEEEMSVRHTWPRLTREKEKNCRIQVDWSRWKDDDGDVDSEDDCGGIGMSYDDLMLQMMSQKVPDETESMPERKLTEEDKKNRLHSDNTKTTNSDGSDDNEYDDLPPLEE